MAVDGQSGETAPADGPQREDGQDQSVAIAYLPHLVRVGRHRGRLIHQRDPEVQRLERRHQAIETILRAGQYLEA